MSNNKNTNKKTADDTQQHINNNLKITHEFKNSEVAMLQMMNYHISQLPFAPKCPGAPLLNQSRRLPDMN